MAEERRDIDIFIDEGFDPEIYSSLSDASLMPLFLQSPSICVHREDLMMVLTKHGIEKRIACLIVPDLIALQISPGSKGAIRGNEFNRIIFDIVKHHCAESYEIERESFSPGIKIDERPDWWIRHRQSTKIIVGYNQIDLWSGGAQSNRASKYLKMKIPGASHLCVVCDKPTLGRATSKKYGIVRLGMITGIMCFPRQLCKFIDRIVLTK